LKGAHNAVVSLENLEEEQLALLRQKYSTLAEQAGKRLQQSATTLARPTSAWKNAARLS
jgi:low affinity Fe/Cu permease